MATRLYPLTRDAATLEKLAGVPAGTTEVLEAVRAQAALLEDELEAWKMVNDHATAGVLDGFHLFGWGRVNYTMLTEAGFDGCADSTSDPAMVRRIGEAHGLDGPTIDLLVESGGVCWA
jgi:hypothetical protein